MNKGVQYNRGFTLIELMIVVAIIGVLAAIAVPSYQRYVIKTKRADMMVELQNIASGIKAQKMAKGGYSKVTISDFNGDYPKSGTALYTVTVTPNPLTSKWTITATPKAGQMTGDGTLTLNYQGIKCRDAKCGTGKKWKE